MYLNSSKIHLISLKIPSLRGAKQKQGFEWTHIFFTWREKMNGTYFNLQIVKSATKHIMEVKHPAEIPECIYMKYRRMPLSWIFYFLHQTLLVYITWHAINPLGTIANKCIRTQQFKLHNRCFQSVKKMELTWNEKYMIINYLKLVWRL